MPMRSGLIDPSLWTVFKPPPRQRARKNQVIHIILISHSILKNPNVAFEANFTHVH